MTNTNTDANGNRLLRTPAGMIANVLVVTPIGFCATRVTRTLIEKARPSDLTKAQNLAFSIGAWGLSATAGTIVSTELFKTVRDLEDVLSPEMEEANPGSIIIDGEVIDVTTK